MKDRLVLGCGNFGGIGSAPELFGRGESEQEAFAIMDAAWETGIRWFDTADAYGGGRSESFVGAWIRTTGNTPTLTTKTFNPMDAGADRGLSRARMRRQIDSSLERLGVATVDAYLAHEFDPETPVEETLATFEELVAAGKIRAYGVSNFSAPQLARAVREGRPRLVQNSYSLLHRTDERDVLPLCRRHGVAYQAFSPLAGGWLTGKYRRGEPFPEGSRMTLRPGPYASLPNERTFAALDVLEALATDRRSSPAAVALAWVLGHPDVTAVVVGPRRPEHLQPALAALELELSPDEREELEAAFL